MVLFNPTYCGVLSLGSMLKTVPDLLFYVTAPLMAILSVSLIILALANYLKYKKISSKSLKFLLITIFSVGLYQLSYVLWGESNGTYLLCLAFLFVLLQIYLNLLNRFGLKASNNTTKLLSKLFFVLFLITIFLHIYKSSMPLNRPSSWDDCKYWSII